MKVLSNEKMVSTVGGCFWQMVSYGSSYGQAASLCFWSNWYAIRG